jgi:hypothetical protein
MIWHVGAALTGLIEYDASKPEAVPEVGQLMAVAEPGARPK